MIFFSGLFFFCSLFVGLNDCFEERHSVIHRIEERSIDVRPNEERSFAEESYPKSPEELLEGLIKAVCEGTGSARIVLNLLGIAP